MKTPRFEETARRWKGKAELFIVYSKEAHAQASGSERLGQFADALAAMDKDGDHAVTLAEYSGPREMFDPFDMDRDEVVRSHELLAARRVAEFSDFAAPATNQERIAAARRLRAAIPGEVPILVDPIGEPTSSAYGGRPNSAFVIDRECKISRALEWASVREVEAALARLAGEPAPVAADPPDLSLLAAPLAAAERAGKPLLLELTALGCGACAKTELVLGDPEVTRALASFERANLRIEEDASWALFEALELSATPAFVVIDPDRAVRARSQGAMDRDAMLAFLRGALVTRSPTRAGSTDQPSDQ